MLHVLTRYDMTADVLDMFSSSGYRKMSIHDIISNFESHFFIVCCHAKILNSGRVSGNICRCGGLTLTTGPNTLLLPRQAELYLVKYGMSYYVANHITLIYQQYLQQPRSLKKSLGMFSSHLKQNCRTV